MVGLSCDAGSCSWFPSPFAVIPLLLLPLTCPGFDVLFEDGFVNVAEALELPSVVNEFVVSELLASGTASLFSCGGLKPASSVGLLLLSLEKSFHLDRFSIVIKIQYGMWMVLAITMGKTASRDNHPTEVRPRASFAQPRGLAR